MKVLAALLIVAVLAQEPASSPADQFLGKYKVYTYVSDNNGKSSYALALESLEITKAGPNGLRIGKGAIVLDDKDHHGVQSKITDDGQTIWSHNFNNKTLDSYTIDDSFLPSQCTVEHRQLDYSNTNSVAEIVQKYVRLGCSVELDDVLFN